MQYFKKDRAYYIFYQIKLKNKALEKNEQKNEVMSTSSATNWFEDSVLASFRKMFRRNS